MTFNYPGIGPIHTWINQAPPVCISPLKKSGQFISFRNFCEMHTLNELSARIIETYNFYVNSTAETYAVVMDMTKLEAEMATSCDMAMMRETFFPMQYSCGLQNNSVYNSPISEAYVGGASGLSESPYRRCRRRCVWRRRRDPPPQGTNAQFTDPLLRQSANIAANRHHLICWPPLCSALY